MARQARVLRLRLALDTNVWTYIGERGDRAAFEELEDRLGCTLVIPPWCSLRPFTRPWRTFGIESLLQRQVALQPACIRFPRHDWKPTSSSQKHGDCGPPTSQARGPRARPRPRRKHG